MHTQKEIQVRRQVTGTSDRKQQYGDRCKCLCIDHSSTATGDSAQAIGERSTATGVDSNASGTSRTATGDQCIGDRREKCGQSGVDANAEGNSSTATGDSGREQIRNQKYSNRCKCFSALTDSSTATGTDAQAIGARSTATGVDSNASARSSTATGTVQSIGEEVRQQV